MNKIDPIQARKDSRDTVTGVVIEALDAFWSR